MNNKEYTSLVEKQQYPENPFVPLDAPFENGTGSIQNLLNTPINGVAVITSKKGSTRSNHSHQAGFHYLYIISGEMEYYERALDEDGSKVIPKIYTKGDMVFTPPCRVHKTIFLQDTVMISMAKLNKDHNSHEEDLIRVEF